MKLTNSVLALFISQLSYNLTDASSLLRYGSSSGKQQQRNLRQVKSSDCTVLIRSDLRIPSETSARQEGDDYDYECEMDAEDMDGVPSLSLPIKASTAQKNALKEAFGNGNHKSGESKLKLKENNGNGPPVFITEDGELSLPPGLQIKLEKKNGGSRSRERDLAVVTGTKPILVVKVTDVNGKARTESSAQIGDDIFGTLGDINNLKSQLYDCSMEKLTVTEGDQSGALPVDSNGVPNNQGVAPGVMEVTIDISLDGNTRGTIRNAVTTKVQEALGETLPGRYQQVMYVLEGCYHTDCGWAAYAYVNSWNSVYQGSYYKMTGVQVHELGHNFNLAHSGGLNGATYTDHTGMMGNPLYSDDVGKMCYNAAKNWQIGWYDDKKVLINPLTQPSTTVTMVGIADYLNNPDGHPVVLKLETGAPNDYFIGFNRATGANAQNDEGDDVVTVVQVDTNDGEWYSQSYLKAKLGFTGDITGNAYTIPNFANTGYAVQISVVSIDLSTNPGTATISIEYEIGTSSPTASPTASPTGTPTASPTASPTISSKPTSTPSVSPTKNPTASPTAFPTRSPIAGPDCPSISKANTCKGTPGCEWAGGRCRNVSAPTPTAPTPTAPTPTAPTPTGGTCSSYTPLGGKACRNNGCNWSKGQCVDP